MTMKDVRSFAWLVADWCVCQDDLTGFSIGIEGPNVVVTLTWHESHMVERFVKHRIEDSQSAAGMLQSLSERADRVRAEIAARAKSLRLRDPNRLPG